MAYIATVPHSQCATDVVAHVAHNMLTSAAFLPAMFALWVLLCVGTVSTTGLLEQMMQPWLMVYREDMVEEEWDEDCSDNVPASALQSNVPGLQVMLQQVILSFLPWLSPCWQACQQTCLQESKTDARALSCNRHARRSFKNTSDGLLTPHWL